jgi:hypothetical protein
MPLSNDDKESYHGNTLMNFGLFVAGLGLGAVGSRMIFGGMQASDPANLEPSQIHEPSVFLPKNEIKSDDKIILHIQIEIKHLLNNAKVLYKALLVDSTGNAKRTKLIKSLNAMFVTCNTFLGQNNVTIILDLLRKMREYLCNERKLFFNVENQTPQILLSSSLRNKLLSVDPKKAATDEQVIDTLNSLIRNTDECIRLASFQSSTQQSQPRSDESPAAQP